MTVKAKNIFEGIPALLPGELIEAISGRDNVRIERIVSRGHASPDNFWYDQEQNEYVMLLKGEAGLLFADSGNTVVLKPGDYIDIPPHVRHRVAWTSPDEDTIWLAVYY